MFVSTNSIDLDEEGRKQRTDLSDNALVIGAHYSQDADETPKKTTPDRPEESVS
jgi:hypothetical protein